MRSAAKWGRPTPLPPACSEYLVIGDVDAEFLEAFRDPLIAVRP